MKAAYRSIWICQGAGWAPGTRQCFQAGAGRKSWSSFLSYLRNLIFDFILRNRKTKPVNRPKSKKMPIATEVCSHHTRSRLHFHLLQQFIRPGGKSDSFQGNGSMPEKTADTTKVRFCYTLRLTISHPQKQLVETVGLPRFLFSQTWQGFTKLGKLALDTSAQSPLIFWQASLWVTTCVITLPSTPKLISYWQATATKLRTTTCLLHRLPQHKFWSSWTRCPRAQCQWPPLKPRSWIPWFGWMVLSCTDIVFIKDRVK